MSITPGELAMMCAAQAATLDQTASIWRASESRTSTLGTAQSFAEVHAAYPCRLAPARPPAEFVAAGRLSGGLTWWVTFAHDADVQPGDEVRIGGRVLKAVGAESGKSYITALRVLCEEAH